LPYQNLLVWSLTLNLFTIILFLLWWSLLVLLNFYIFNWKITSRLTSWSNKSGKISCLIIAIGLVRFKIAISKILNCYTWTTSIQIIEKFPYWMGHFIIFVTFFNLYIIIIFFSTLYPFYFYITLQSFIVNFRRDGFPF
jgi:hypothetical protein